MGNQLSENWWKYEFGLNMFSLAKTHNLGPNPNLDQNDRIWTKMPDLGPNLMSQDQSWLPHVRRGRGTPRVAACTSPTWPALWVVWVGAWAHMWVPFLYVCVMRKTQTECVKPRGLLHYGRLSLCFPHQFVLVMVCGYLDHFKSVQIMLVHFKSILMTSNTFKCIWTGFPAI